MKTGIVDSNTQPVPYSGSCQGKALLVALTVLAYIAAIVGIVCLKALPGRVLMGIGIPLSLVLTGACFYFFRKVEEINSSSQESALSATSEVLVLCNKKVIASIEISLNETVRDLRTKIKNKTGKENAIIAVDGEIVSDETFTNIDVKLKQHGISLEWCSLEIFDKNPQTILVTYGEQGGPISLFVHEDGNDLEGAIAKRNFVPREKIRTESREQGMVHAFIKCPDGLCKLSYGTQTLDLTFYNDETFASLKRRIESMTDVLVSAQKLNLPPGIKDDSLMSTLNLAADTILVLEK